MPKKKVDINVDYKGVEEPPIEGTIEFDRDMLRAARAAAKAEKAEAKPEVPAPDSNPVVRVPDTMTSAPKEDADGR